MLGDSLHSSTRINLSSSFELNFFSLLHQVSHRMSIFLSVPETFVLGFGFEKPTLICSDRKTGELLFEDNLTLNGIQEGFKYFKEVSVNNLPIALIKTQNNLHDKCRLVYSVIDCINSWDSHVKSNKSVMIQRFIYSGKIAKYLKADYSIEDGLSKLVCVKKSIKVNKRNSVIALPDLTRQNYSNILDEKNWIIRRKDLAEYKDIAPEFGIKNQVMNLGQVIEKFYSSNKNCRVEKIESVWMYDKNENFYLINLKSFKILNIIFKPIQMNKKVLRNKSFFIQEKKEYKVVARTKKNIEGVVRFRTASYKTRSGKLLLGNRD